MRSVRWSLLAGALAAAAANRVARASPPVLLEWSAPATCPSRDQVLDDIAGTVGGNASPISIRARVVVTQDGETFRAQLGLQGAGDEALREFDARSCRAVVDAVVLVVALAVAPDAQPRDSPGEEPAAPPPTPPPAPSRRERDGVVPVATKPGALGPYSVVGSLTLDTGLLPSVTYGGELALAATRNRVDLELLASLFATQTATLSDAPSQGARITLAHGGARACYQAFDAPIALGPCAEVGLDWLIAHGFGPSPDVPADATGQIFEGALGARATVRLSSRFALRIIAEGVVPFARPTFSIDGAGTVFHAPVLSFRAATGAEAHF